jgi:hypothetical protein
MKKNFYLIITLILLSEFGFSQGVRLSGSKEVVKSIEFVDSLGKVYDSIVIMDNNPWNKLKYRKSGTDKRGNHTYIINRSELTELFSNQFKTKLINFSALKYYQQFYLDSEPIIYTETNGYVVISYSLFCTVNSDEIVSAKSYILIYDLHKNLISSCEFESFINGSVAISGNGRYLAYLTGVNWADGEIKPIGFEIYDLVKKKVIYETTRVISNYVGYYDKVEMISISMYKENSIRSDIYFSTRTENIYSYDYNTDDTDILIDITAEGIVYMTRKGTIKNVYYKNMKSIPQL